MAKHKIVTMVEKLNEQCNKIVYRTKFCHLIVKIQVVKLSINFEISKFPLMLVAMSLKYGPKIQTFKVILFKYMVND